jgi:predicted 2-oxoglutarate/Fe(II)-dependent dioxygenase YbiX
MPHSSFFRNLGLFVRNDFLSPDTCAQIRTEMCTSETWKALIYRGETGEGILDEGVRKSLRVRVQESTITTVREQMRAIKPSVEQHFQMSLGDCDPPNFLSYGEGAYFKPHLDASGHPDISYRQVSLVVFLNACTKEPAENCYGGGSLTFYGLMKGPKWEDCAFSLEADMGSLLAFRSDILHEVQPVTFGQRFSIVSWFQSVGSA